MAGINGALISTSSRQLSRLRLGSTRLQASNIGTCVSTGVTDGLHVRDVSRGLSDHVLARSFSSKGADENGESSRLREFRKKLRERAPIEKLEELEEGKHPYQEKEALKPFPNNTNPETGEIGGPRGPEPTRYGDWERKGRVTDF